jgi:hypothetical protein
MEENADNAGKRYDGNPVGRPLLIRDRQAYIR